MIAFHSRCLQCYRCVLINLYPMKTQKNYNTYKPSKGERLHWPRLEKQNVVPVTEDMLQSRRISENEIENRQRVHNGKISLLVP
jgi:hypothetical protein